MIASGIRYLTVACAAMMPFGNVLAQSTPDCGRGVSEVFLDAGNARARLANNGTLFLGGTQNPGYTIPWQPEHSVVGPELFVSVGLWFGGMVDGELAMNRGTYLSGDFRPGILDENGEPPADCNAFDRIYRISRDDVEEYDRSGSATADLRDWPAHLGAPVIDGDGQPDNYSLSGGDRPDMSGDQMAWWVMQDRGSPHPDVVPHPGLEVRSSAFAFDEYGDIGNTTFYRFNLSYRGESPITDAYFGLYADVDLGYALDDYIGSDSALGLAYFYNADNLDEEDGYGVSPPAMGVDFLRAPGSTSTNSISSIIEYRGLCASPLNCDLREESEWEYSYGMMLGQWPSYLGDICVGGNGRSDSDVPCEGTTRFIYSGDPVGGSGWSEVNVDGKGATNEPGDRRLVISTGPFDMNPGDTKEVVVAVIWARGANNLDSVTEIKKASVAVQRAFDADFEQPVRMPAPSLAAVDSSDVLVLDWSPIVNGSDIEAMEIFSPSAAGPDSTYSFEGYDVFQFASAAFDTASATRIATYDIDNGIGTVVDYRSNLLSYVSATGSDTGVRHRHVVEGLNPYTEYYFGVQPYAHNGDTDAGRILRGEMATIAVVPTGIDETFSLEDVGIVPNPYKGASDYEVVTEANLVRFTGMAERATVRVFTLSGALVTTMQKDSPERYFEWDLTNEYGRKIGSGVYLVQIDVPGVGSRVLKFGVVRRGGAAVLN
ncbi:MAG: hypothetical protein R2832_17015 [Rhodothermales bacterium]